MQDTSVQPSWSRVESLTTDRPNYKVQDPIREESTMKAALYNGDTQTPEDVIGSLTTARLSELEAFHTALQTPLLQKQVEDDEVFEMVLQLAIDDYGVSQGELAEVLNTTTSTVGRWKQGRVAPSSYARAGILSAVASCLSSIIAGRRAA